MKASIDCMLCCIKQAEKVSRGYVNDIKIKLMQSIFSYLSKADNNIPSPALMKHTWNIITSNLGDKDPYKYIKRKSNDYMLCSEEVFYKIISESRDTFTTIIKLAAIANNIDFAAYPDLNIDELFFDFEEVLLSPLLIDHSNYLYNDIKKANSLVYLGDNAGEIVVDKILIRYISNMFKDIKIYYIVKEKPILNDVTITDAKYVKMHKLCEVITSGDNASGFIYDDSSDNCKEIFKKADIIIAKGQGNYEGLSDMRNRKIYHILSVKCEVICKRMGLMKKGIVCYSANSNRI